MHKSNELKQERAAHFDAAQSLLKQLEVEHRDFSTREKGDLDQHYAKINILDLEIREAERQEDVDLVACGGTPRKRSGASITPTLAPPEYAVTPEGQKMRLLAPSESMRSVTENTLPDNARPEEFSIGRAIRGVVTGNWKDAQLERRTFAESAGASGGYLLEPIMAAEFIDLARNKAVVYQAGARTLPMVTAEVPIARLVSDPAAQWKPENVALTPDTTMTLGQFVLKAKTLACLVTASIEIIEDAANLESIVKNSISEALALELDRAILRGSGASTQINGLRNWTTGTPAINVVDLGTNGAALTDYSEFSTAVQKVLEGNGVPNAVIFAPRTWGVLDRLVTTTVNNPMTPPASFAALQKLVSNQIPINLTKGTSSIASDAFVGDFTKILVGVRTQLTLEISRQAGDAFAKGQVWIRAYMRADMIPTQPKHFTLIDGIVP